MNCTTVKLDTKNTEVEKKLQASTITLLSEVGKLSSGNKATSRNSALSSQILKGCQQTVQRIQYQAMRLICSKPPRTPSEELRRDLKWMTLQIRRELHLVQRCVHNQAPTSSYQTNEECHHRVTRGCKKIHLRTVRTEYGRKATGFKGAQA